MSLVPRSAIEQTATRTYHRSAVVQISVVFRSRIFELNGTRWATRADLGETHRQIVGAECLFQILRMVFNHEVEADVGIGQRVCKENGAEEEVSGTTYTTMLRL